VEEVAIQKMHSVSKCTGATSEQRQSSPTASNSNPRSGLTSSRCSGSSHSAGLGSAGQCRSFSRFLGRSSSTGSSAACFRPVSSSLLQKGRGDVPITGSSGRGGGSYLFSDEQLEALCCLKQATEQLSREQGQLRSGVAEQSELTSRRDLRDSDTSLHPSCCRLCTAGCELVPFFEFEQRVERRQEANERAAERWSSSGE